jgi:hypothetical protein
MHRPPLGGGGHHHRRLGSFRNGGSYRRLVWPVGALGNVSVHFAQFRRFSDKALVCGLHIAGLQFDSVAIA